MGGLAEAMARPREIATELPEADKDPAIDSILQQLGVPADGQLSPEQLRLFNELYNKILQERGLRRDTWDYPFREYDAYLG